MFENAWNSFRKYVGFEKPELFANRYMAEMDARIRKNLTSRMDLREVYSVEMQKLEDLQTNIVTPPATVWKQTNYQNRRIHTLNKIIKKYRNIFSREVDDKFNEAILFNIKMQSEDDVGRTRFFSDIKEQGKPVVIGNNADDRLKFKEGLNDRGKIMFDNAKIATGNRTMLFPVGTFGHPSIFQLEKIVENNFKTEKQNNIEKMVTLEGSVYKDIATAISEFSIDALIPDISKKDSEQMDLLSFKDNFNTLLTCIKNVDSDPQKDKSNWEEKLYNLIDSNELQRKTAHPIGEILNSRLGWNFMLSKHPHMLIEFIADNICYKIDDTCKNILSHSGDLSQLNNNEYLKLIAIRQALSCIMAELPLNEQRDNLRKEFEQYNNYYNATYSVSEFSKSPEERQKMCKERYDKAKKGVLEHNRKFDYYSSVIKEKPFVEKLDKVLLNNQKQKKRESLHTIYEQYMVSEYLKSKEHERIASDNLFLCDLGELLESGLSKGKGVSDRIIKKFYCLSDFCSCNDVDRRIKRMEEIFNVKEKDFVYKDLTSSGLNNFVHLIFSGTAASEKTDKTGLGYICQSYPGLLGKITFEILLNELSRSMNASGFKELVQKGHKVEFLSPLNRKISMKCLEHVKTEYDAIVAASAMSHKSYFANYQLWKNMVELNLPIGNNYVTHKDLTNLCSNDTDILTNLCNKYKDDYLLKQNVEYRKECFQKIDHIIEYPAINIDDKKKNQKDEKIVKSGVFVNNYHLKDFKHHVGSDSNDNWALALTDMICFKGTGKGLNADKYLHENLDKDVIKSYRTVPVSYEEDPGYKKMDGLNRSIPSEIGHHMNIISKILPNSALHKISIKTENAGINEKPFSEWLGKQIETSVKSQQAPLCYCCENDYMIITGMNNDNVLYYKPSSEKQQIIPLNDLKKSFMNLISNDRQVDFYWLTDVTPEFEESCKKPNGAVRFKKGKTTIELLTSPLNDGYVHENYNAFKVDDRRIKKLDGKEEYIYLPKRELKNAW